MDIFVKTLNSTNTENLLMGSGHLMREGHIITITGICCLLISIVVPLEAHHAFSSEFDSNQPIRLEGTVTKVEWINPHAWIHISVENQDATVTAWEVELGSPNTLIRYKWTRDTAKLGDVLTIDGYLSKDGLDRINAKSVVLPDGRLFEAGSSGLSSTR